VDINSLCNTAGIWNNLTLHTAVFEYTTYNNVGTNGEIEFYNIMKKMLPDHNGTSLPVLSGPNNPTFSLSMTYEFNGSYNIPLDASIPTDHLIEHSIEDFENLGVVVWIQDNDSKYILQSANASMVANTNDINVTSKTSLFPNPAINHLNVVSNVISNGQVDVEIYNSLGQIIKTIQWVNLDKIQTIDISGLENGLYTLVIQTSNNLISRKFTKVDY
jgi:hypothetical protein